MARGVVITSNSSFHEIPGKVDFSGGIKTERLNQFLTYWDKIVCVDSNIFGGFDVNNFPDIKLLTEEGVFSQLIEKLPEEYPKDINSMFFSRPLAQRIAFEKLIHDKNNIWSMGQNGNLLFVPQRNNEEMDVIEVTLTNALPIPKNCSIEKILEFKNKRRAEFLNFQFVFDEMKDNIKNSENKHMALLKEKEKIEKALLELNKVFHESKFEKTVRTIKTFINIDDSALLSSLFPLIGTMTAGRFSISPEIGTLVGLGINASINLSMKKESKIETLGLDLKPYAYLFEVENIK